MVFATDALSYQALSNFKMSCGSVLTIPVSINRNLFIEDSHIIDISVAVTGGRARGVDLVHLLTALLEVWLSGESHQKEPYIREVITWQFSISWAPVEALCMYLLSSFQLALYFLC